jgi:hypothetical protein
MHDYIFYSIAAFLYFIIYLDVRRGDKKYKRKKHPTMIFVILLDFVDYFEQAVYAS